MYQAARAATPAKTPEALDEIGAPTQRRYLMLAEAAMEAMGETKYVATEKGRQEAEAAGEPSLGGVIAVTNKLAEELAYKVNHPMHFSEGIREAFGLYTQLVGVEQLSDEVKQASEV